MLERFCGVEWQIAGTGARHPIEGSSLVVEPFEAGGDPPRYSDLDVVEASGLVFRDAGGVVTYVPGLARSMTA